MFVEIASSILIILTAVFICLRWSTLAAAIISGTIIRLVLLWCDWVGVYFTNKPKDAVQFLEVASYWSRDGLGQAFAHFPGISSHAYSWLMALLFSVVGEYEAVAQSINVCLSLLVIAVTGQLARSMWSNSAALATSWIIAMWPAFLWVGIPTLRETAIMLCLVYGVLSTVQWIAQDRLREGIKALFAITVAGFLHGGLFVALPIVLLVVAFSNVNRFLLHARSGQLPLTPVVSLVFAVVGVGLFMVSGSSVAKIGSFEELSDISYLEERLQRERGAATFPAFVTQQTGAAMFITLPVRFVFFTGGPFLWNARSAEQLMGASDGLLLLLLLGLVAANLPIVWRNRNARAVFLLWLMLMVVFAAGTANFGTALRHRVKFAPELIALASPFLLRRFPTRGRPDARKFTASSDNALNTNG